MNAVDDLYAMVADLSSRRPVMTYEEAIALVADGFITAERDRQAFNEYAASLDDNGLRALSMLMVGPPSTIVRHDDGTTEYQWGEE